MLSRPWRVSSTRIFAELSPKGWIVLEVCMTLVPMITIASAAPQVIGVNERPPAVWVCLRVSVRFSIDI